MSGACSPIPEIHTPAKPRFLASLQVKPPVAPDPYLAPLSRRACVTLLGMMVGAVLVLFFVQFVRGFAAEHRAAVAGRIAAEARAESAERQLAEMLKHGDQGVLIANVSKDLVGWQVRLVPATNNYRGRN